MLDGESVDGVNRANASEELCRIINEFFTELINIVHEFGGDIVKVCEGAGLRRAERERDRDR